MIRGLSPTLFVFLVLLPFCGAAAPVISSATHSPPVPSPGVPVRVTAQILDGTAATLNWRVDGAPAFQTVTMLAAGTTWSADIPPQTNGALVEFAVIATGGGSAAWPSPSQTALLRVEESAVDSPWAAGAVPVWRLLARAADGAALADGTAVQASVVIRDGSGLTVRHAGSLRQTEASPKAYHLVFPPGGAWEGRLAVSFNADRPHAQAMGAAVFARAGLPTAKVETIEVRTNGVNAAVAGSPSFGRFALSEPFDAAWAARQFPASPGGNLYRLDDSGPGTHGALGYEIPADTANYAETYLKVSGPAPHDLADVIALTERLANAPQGAYRAEISQRLDLDQWLRQLALDSLLGHGEPGLQTGRGTDVVLYHLPATDRFLLVPRELRAILGRGLSAGTETRSLFSSDSTAGLNRMMTHPEVLADYTKAVRKLLDGIFLPAVLDPLMDQLMEGWVPAAEITAIQQYVVARRNSASAELPATTSPLTISGDAAAVEGMATTATGTIQLSGTFPVAQVGAITVNGQQATLNFRTLGPNLAGTWRLTVTTNNGALRRGVNHFLVEFWTGPGGAGSHLLTQTGVAYYSGGGTTVGIITGAEVHWTAAGSPYRLAANATVPAGTALIIEPGVSVFFAPARKLTVNGTIKILGTAQGRVRLSHTPGATPEDNPHLPGTQIGPPKWGGIIIQGSLTPLNVIAYADFYNAETSADLGSITANQSSIQVDHCSFWGTKYHALYGESSSVIVQDSYFPDSYLPGENPLDLGLDNASEFIQLKVADVSGPGFTGNWPTGGVLRFYRNTFGGLPGHNDLIDVVAGKWGVTPVLDIQDNRFLGPVGDEAIDMEGDSYIAGNFFSNIRKDQYTEDLGYANALSMAALSGVVDTTAVFARNVFTRVDHVVMQKGNVGTIIEHNTIACHNHDYPFAVGNETQTVRTSVAGFYIPEDDKTPGDGAYLGYNLIYGAGDHPAGAAAGFPRVFSFADSKGTTTKIELFANFLDPAIQDPVIGVHHASNVLHSSWQGVTGNPQFINVAADDYSLAPGSPARGSAPHGLDYGAGIPKGCYLDNLPPLITAQNTAGILVGGPGIFAYKWRLDSGAWSGAVSIAPGVFPRNTVTVRTGTLSLNALTTGPHTLEVVGQDFAGNWTSDAEATRASWTVNPALPLLFLEEVQAGPGGGIEIFNGGGGPIALSGWSLTDTPITPGQYLLSGTLPAGARLTLPAMLTGLNLSAAGGAVFLYQGGTQRDTVAFGPQATGWSLGRIVRDRIWAPCSPTPNAPNRAVLTGASSRLRFSEWVAGSPGWVEISNTDSLPVALDGLALTTNLPGATVAYTFPAHSLIAPGGFFVLYFTATLTSPGTVLSLLDGVVVLDSIQISRSAPGTSEGRNNSGQVIFFPTATPGAAHGSEAPTTLPQWLSSYGATLGSDQDGDASIALAEYAFGTSPLDSNSVTRIALLRPEADGLLKIRFALPGAGRFDIDYRLESSPAVTGPWTLEAMKQGVSPWTGTVPVITGAAEGGYSPVRVNLLPAHPRQMFYRVRLVPK